MLKNNASPFLAGARFPILKCAPHDAHLSGLYCLAAAAHWFHRFDFPKKPTISAILGTMLVSVPPNLPRMGIIEKHLRAAGDAYDLHMYRPTVFAIMGLEWPADWIWLVAVRRLPVPRLQEPPPERRYVLVLGLPDDQARFLVADPHPGTPSTYRVAIERFGPAWAAGATSTHRASAVVISSRW